MGDRNLKINNNTIHIRKDLLDATLADTECVLFKAVKVKIISIKLLSVIFIQSVQYLLLILFDYLSRVLGLLLHFFLTTCHGEGNASLMVG
jgi:hypothetical protein